MSKPILYNVTVHVEKTIIEDWLDWMIKVHIPDVMKTGYFQSYQLSKVLVDSDDGSSSYAIQYKLDSMESFHKYTENFAKSLQKDHLDRYGDKCLAIRTMLELIHSG